jgi:TPR repeat protein
MEVRQSMTYADEAKRLGTTSHEAMLAGRDPWPDRAQAGDLAAMAGLGRYFYLRHNRAEAEHWFEYAAAGGDPEGCYDLGVMRREDGRDAEAEQLFTRAAQAGLPKAMTNVADLALKRGDHGTAMRWAGQAAQAGNLNGMINYGVMLLISGHDKDARKWFDAAIAVGGPGARQRISDQVARAGQTLP